MVFAEVGRETVLLTMSLGQEECTVSSSSKGEITALYCFGFDFEVPSIECMT